jgi:asparagine synthase (glutamine-hydrolysing)
MQRAPIAALNSVGNVLPGRYRISRLGDKLHKLGSGLQRTRELADLYQALLTAWPPDSGIVRGSTPLRTALDVTRMGNGFPDLEHRIMLWDAVGYLPDDILHKVDRAAMGTSLETRAPFLDHRVAQLAYRLPVNMKIRNGVGKWILREILNRHVPQPLVDRPKMGFAIALDSWLRGPLREWAEGLLSESKLRSEGFLDPKPVGQKWAEHLAGRRNWQNDLWAVLMFESWLESVEGPRQCK